MPHMEPNFDKPEHAWWVRPSDGRLLPLILQGAEDPAFLPHTSRWTRLGKPISQVTLFVRLCNWIGSSLFIEGSREFRSSLWAMSMVAIKYVVSFPLLWLLLCLSDTENSEAIRQIQSENALEHFPATSSSKRSTTDTPDQPHRENLTLSQENPGLRPPRTGEAPEDTYTTGNGRHSEDYAVMIRPRYLCIIKDFDEGTYETVNVSKYREENGDNVDLEFVFVSYTRVHFRVATDGEISSYQYPNEATREANRQIATRDRATLVKWGIDAAKRVQKRAFWLDYECLPDDGVAKSTTSSEDVYKICDIVRAAHSMIIAIGPPVADRVEALLSGVQPESLHFDSDMVTPWLRQWGSRLWTLPELLLCPGEYRIRLYVVGDPFEPKAIAKRNFAERAWDDAYAVKQLVDHFEGSAILSPSTLLEAALTCFSTRQTDQFSQGDIAYATMGLFPSRHRPRVDKNDTGFQAFGKLAFENRSLSFLQRLLCLSTPQGSPWYRMEDRWKTKLRDIQPIGNLRSILGPETIILDGIYGTTVNWDQLDAEPYLDRAPGFNSWLLYYVPKIVTGYVTMCFLITNFLLSRPILFIYWHLLAICGFVLVFPKEIIRSRGRPMQPTKPRLVGIEGFMDAATVERYLWGFNHGNLKTETHEVYTDVTDSQSQTMPHSPATEEGHAFTLVDTHSLSVFHVHCSMPPVAMFICGEENNIHRAVFCSYDWITETYHRQFVLRSSRWDMERFGSVNNVHLSLAPHPKNEASSEIAEPVSASIITSSDSIRRETALKAVRPSKLGREFLFVVMCIVCPHLYRYSSLEEPKRMVQYGLSSVLAQPLALLFLLKIPVRRVFLYAILVEVYLQLVLIPDDPPWGSITYLPIIRGIVDGCKVSVVLLLIPEWYSSRELPLRLLLWMTAAPKMEVLLEHFGITFLYFRDVASLSHLWFTYNVLSYSAVSGRPREVPWLETCQKVVLSGNVGIRKFLNDSGGRLWNSRKSAMRYARSLSIMFILSFLNAVLPGPRKIGQDGFRCLYGAEILIVSTIGLAIFWKFSAMFLFIVTILCSMISGCTLILYKLEFFTAGTETALHIFTGFRELVLPLLCSMAVFKGACWAQAAGLMSMSMIGSYIGSLLLYCTAEWRKESLNTGVCAVLLLLRAMSWCFFWRYELVDNRADSATLDAMAQDLESDVSGEQGSATT